MSDGKKVEMVKEGDKWRSSCIIIYELKLDELKNVINEALAVEITQKFIIGHLKTVTWKL
jgi:hypothetical protein